MRMTTSTLISLTALLVASFMGSLCDLTAAEAPKMDPLPAEDAVDPADRSLRNDLMIRGQNLAKRLIAWYNEATAFDARYANEVATPDLLAEKSRLAEVGRGLLTELKDFNAAVATVRLKPVADVSPSPTGGTGPNSAATEATAAAAAAANARAQQAIAHLAESILGAPPPERGGLTFNHQKTGDAFGTEKANPGRGFAKPGSEEDESATRGLGFDTPGKMAKSPPPANNPTKTESFVIPDHLRSHPEAVKLNQYREQEQQARAAARAAQQRYDAEKRADPKSQRLAKLLDDARMAQDKTRDLGHMVTVQTETVKKISFAKIPTGGAAPPPVVPPAPKAGPTP